MPDIAPGGHRLLLLRHAKALGAAGPAGEAGDHARDLSERGLRDAMALGGTMRQRELKPDLVLVSSALRTRRTLEMLEPFEGPAPAVVPADRFYLAEADELLAALHEVPDTIGILLLIGHNPGLHELASYLSGGEAGAPAELRAGMPTCTLVSLSVGGAWRDLQPRSVGNTQVIRP